MANVDVSRLEQVESLPDDALVRGGWVKELVAEMRREAASLAADRELTLQMWEDIATRYISSPAPEWDTDQTPGPGPTRSGPEV